MNHLEEAKENIKLIGTINQPKNVNALMNVTQSLALIAIAESQEKTAKETDSIRGWLVGIEKNTAVIAEQLERMNNQELRTEKLDFHSVTRKVDK